MRSIWDTRERERGERERWEGTVVLELDKSDSGWCKESGENGDSGTGNGEL